MSACQSVCLSACLSVRLSCLSANVGNYLTVCLSDSQKMSCRLNTCIDRSNVLLLNVYLAADVVAAAAAADILRCGYSLHHVSAPAAAVVAEDAEMHTCINTRMHRTEMRCLSPVAAAVSAAWRSLTRTHNDYMRAHIDTLQ